MASNPQRQHWVPQFYLRYFSAPSANAGLDPQIWMFSRRNEDRDAHLVGIKNAAVERHLYSPVLQDGSRDFGIEAKLSKLEGLMSLRWDDLGRRYVDLAKDVMLKKTLALFMAVQMLRTRKAMQDSHALHREIVAMLDSLPHDDAGRPRVDLLTEPFSRVDAASWDEFKSSSSNRVQQSFADQIFPVGFNLVETLLAKRWSIIVSREPVFMTSDCPVIMNHPHKKKFGIRTRGTTITFPLSPTRMLLLNDEFDRAPNRYWHLKVGGQHWFNLITWAGCDRFVFAPFDPVTAIDEARATVEQVIHREEVEHRLGLTRTKIGRNDPCDCGSGEKWKRCCGKA